MFHQKCREEELSSNPNLKMPNRALQHPIFFQVSNRALFCQKSIQEEFASPARAGEKWATARQQSDSASPARLM
jgi:hypothetical protein